MANKTISMLQIRRMLQLMDEGRSKRYISRELGISRGTVDSYEHKIRISGLTLQQLLCLKDAEVFCFLRENAITFTSVVERRKAELDNRLDYFLSELKRTGVTRQLLWREYKSSNPDGYGYTQFCEYLSQERSLRGVTMHLEHNPGEKLQIDFAGKMLHYTDVHTGERKECPVVVCVLPFSGYTYVEALENAGQRCLYESLGRCLRYLGGVPMSVTGDNMKQYVIKPDRYEPTFNTLAEQWAVYYNTTLMAARVGKARDKPTVEKGVHISYLRIFAPLRDRTFRSLPDLNQAILECLDIHNSTAMKAYGLSREQRFENEEKQYLKPLPAFDFIIRHETRAKVQRNYHVILGEDMHQYSVPYIHVGKEVKIIYDFSEVEIYLGLERIALHLRSVSRNGYTTKEEHMPERHRGYQQTKGWNADYFLREASKIGVNTQSAVKRLLDRNRFPEQTYNACLGIFSLGRKYGNDRLEAACKRAMAAPTTSYQFIRNILKNNQDKLQTADDENFNIPDHENIRGKESYK
ncbi:MAG: IS21 family transposase [Dysgonamonadaceae bacterium]|jgi:transposase|nr:IS21 family transposase [Dysgonamonadaceae bacterium]